VTLHAHNAAPKRSTRNCRSTGDNTPAAMNLFVAFLVVTNFAQALFLEKTQPKKQSLLARRTADFIEDPGFNRNFGVNGGIPTEDMGSVGDDGSEVDSVKVERNMWTSDSMSYNFPFLDNLEPTAPMDRVHNGDGAYGLDTVYVSKYTNPDAFPTVVGAGCVCENSKDGKPIKCDCGKSGHTDHYTWLKDTPIEGTNKYTLKPADISYRAGDYWEPNPRGGIVSPADAMPLKHYPNQGPADAIWPLPARAAGDAIGVKYARYIDQVHARSEECDTVSKKCTVPCKPGDAVVVAIGNTRLNAKIVKTFVGNAAQVEFSPNAAAGATSFASCPLEASCTAFRFCKGQGPCIPMRDVSTKNWQGIFTTKNECPVGSAVCKTVNQVVMSTMLTKEGKTCRAAA